MKKFLMLTIRGSFRSVRNHPFVVVVLCFLIFMYRSYPFMFTLLVSASPILICTAVLLGTLLSFGQRNIPELEIEEKTTPLKTGLSTDAIIVEQHDKYYVDRYIEKRRDETNDSTKANLGESCGKSNSNDTSPLIEESKLENGEILRELDDETIDKKKNKWMNEGNVETDDEKSVADSFDSERVNVDCLDSPPHSPWKDIEDDHEEEEEEEVEEEVEEDDEEEDTLDSGSDRAESSSPDASMADIMPMLDELHPLLDEEAAQNVQTSRDNSDAASEHSTESTTTATTTTNESCDEIETHDELEEVAEDDDDDEDDDEAKEDDKEEQTKSAITWTEEDQKNLMDLGSSEIERNQRLENLILRRRTRKYTSMVPEINLIDLESSDIPFNVAPISTSRQNPFDLPHDSCDNSGLPPIPGSAPSVLLPRRNPFDIPFDCATEEKPPNLTGDGFSREELTALHLREPFFRRHESFNVGPSIFAPNNRGDVKLRPYFVPERMVSEESGYFHRQSSEMSDSKVSSVPETESVGSVEDLEYQNLTEEDNTPSEIEAISKMEEVIEECPSEEDREVGTKREFSEEEEEDVHCEPELISEMEHVSEHIGHGSQSSSSEEDSLEVGRVETRDVEEHYVEESAESTDPSVDNPLVDEVPHKEPVYDSSPTSRKNISSSSSSSDMHVPHVLVKRTVSFTERESENRGVDENGSLCVDDTNVREHDNIKGDSTVDVSIPSKPSVEASLEENVTDKNTQGRAPSSSSGLDIHAMADDDKKMGKSEKEKCLLIKGDDSIDKGETVVSPNSDADYEEANEKLISTPSAGGSTPLFYDIRMHDNDYEHHDEVQVPNTPVESFETVRAIQNLNISEVHDLDHGISRKINSPFTPDFVSVPSSSTSSEESTSRVDMETILEEDDEIKEMDGILSELDSVGDFSTTQWGSSSNESDEKHVIDSVVENSSSANRVEETSTDEVNKTEHGHSTREEIDIHEEDIESISELPTSEASTTAEKNSTANSALNHVYEDGISQKPELETQSTQCADSLPKKGDLASTLETDDQVHVVMKQSSEIEKPVVVEPPEAQVAIRQSAAEHSESEAMHLHTNVVGPAQKTPVLEVSSIDNAGENTAEAVPSEGASLTPSKKLEDDNSEKEVKPKMDDGSVQVEADKVVGSSSVGPDESSVKEGSSVGTEKLENEVKAKSVKGKGKSSKKSKTGSSSSSSSSSSDSD